MMRLWLLWKIGGTVLFLWILLRIGLSLGWL